MVRKFRDVPRYHMGAYSPSIAYCATACERGTFGQGRQSIFFILSVGSWSSAFYVPFRFDCPEEEADDFHPAWIPSPRAYLLEPAC